MKTKILTIITIILAIAISDSCKMSESDRLLLNEARLHFKALPADFFGNGPRPSEERIELGRRLFFEKSISIDGKTGCVTCHPVEKYGADRLPRSIGNNNKLNPRNAPTVLNAAPQFAQHWRGDRSDVEDQALRALTGPASFGAPDTAFVENLLKQSPVYQKGFALAFPDQSDPVTAQNLADAIGAYERTLVSRSRFDDFLQGEAGALSAKEKEGLSLFMKTGCINCHNGVLVGGGSFQKFGVMKDYTAVLYTGERKAPDTVDHGLMDITKKESDRDLFKVPSLRNVEMTAPYFHDGSINDLSPVVIIMADIQLGKKLSENEIASIVSFLKSLTGEIPENFSDPQKISE